MNKTFQELHTAITTPSLIAEKKPYTVRFALTDEDIRATQKLRYSAFSAHHASDADPDGIDQDDFDRYAAHLTVIHENHKAPIGTYRIMLGHLFDKSIGLYSAREYNVDAFEDLFPNALEVGRSCVSEEFRNGTVVALLWAGMSEIMSRSGKRYLFGCPSMEVRDPAVVWALYDSFVRDGLTLPDRIATPRPGFELPRPDESAIAKVLESPEILRSVMPPLLKGYIRMGAKICGYPAFDHEFGSIDFLISVDVARLPQRYMKHFNVTVEEK